MDLTLGVVVDRAPDHCAVRILGEPGTRPAGYAAPFASRAGSLRPGWLVALDTATVPAQVVWRWFPATVVAVADGRVRLDKPHHGVIEAPDVEPAVAVGDVVHVTTALSEGWRIDAPATDPERARGALADVAALYARF